MTIKSKHILPLTSLRFFAALMIFILHASDRLGMPNFRSVFGFSLGVSFFYVLSGFILTYVYFRPGAKLNLRQFFRKRFFRLYPMHIATLIAAIVLIPAVKETFGQKLFQLPLQLTMTQSWLGTRSVAFGFNGPAWSISAEFGFYILFPFLLKFYHKIYTFFFASIVLTVTAILAALYLDGAVSHWLWQALEVHPFGRMMEFICGMCAAKLFLQFPNISWSNKVFSGLEIIAISLIILLGSLNREINDGLAGFSNQLELVGYIKRSGLFLFFAALIWVVAQERGFISQWLSNKTLVLLGNMSFAFYLIHLIVIRFFEHHYEFLLGYPPLIIFAGLFLLSLGFAYVAYNFIEVPLQKLGRKDFSHVFLQRKESVKSRKAFIVLGLTLIFGVSLTILRPGYQPPSEETLAAFKAESIAADIAIMNVDGVLSHYRFQKEDEWMCYEMLWEFSDMNHDTPLKRVVNVHFPGRRKTLSNKIILPPSAWQNAEGEKIHVLDDFCIPYPGDEPNASNNLMTRIILRQKTETGFEPLKFKHNGGRQNLLLLDHAKPEYFLWRQ